MSLFFFYFLNKNHWNQLDKNESQRHSRHIIFQLLSPWARNASLLLCATYCTLSAEGCILLAIQCPVILDSAFCLICSRGSEKILVKKCLWYYSEDSHWNTVSVIMDKKKVKKQWWGWGLKILPPPCLSSIRVVSCLPILNFWLPK